MTHQDIRSYFGAEKNESLLFIIIGVVSIVCAILFFFLKSKLYLGAAFPLLLIGLIQIVVGYTVYSRTDKQSSDVVYSYDLNPDYFKQKELPRMEAVNKSFDLYRSIEIGLAVLAAVLIWYNYSKNNIWLGVGVGLLIQSLIMLTSDFYAEKRADVYTDQIKEYLSKNH